jgi:hypothetical protein
MAQRDSHKTTAGTASNIKQAAWWGIWKPQTPKAGTRPRRGLPESDPNPSQRLKPKGSTLRPWGSQGAVVTAVRVEAGERRTRLSWGKLMQKAASGGF